MRAKKIAIVGITGSGKTLLSRRIADRTGLPLFHMDALFWRDGWNVVPEAEYLIGQERLLALDAWIIEGWVDLALADRVKAADLVIYLDYSSVRCVGRYVRRVWQHRRTARSELPAECLERFKWRQFWVVLTRAERRPLETVLAMATSRVIRLKSPRALERYLANSDI